MNWRHSVCRSSALLPHFTEHSAMLCEHYEHEHELALALTLPAAVAVALVREQMNERTTHTHTHTSAHNCSERAQTEQRRLRERTPTESAREPSIHSAFILSHRVNSHTHTHTDTLALPTFCAAAAVVAFVVLAHLSICHLSRPLPSLSHSPFAPTKAVHVNVCVYVCL